MEPVPCTFAQAGRHDGRVRFQVSQTLDAIERRLSTDPLRAAAVLDLAEVVHLVDLDAAGSGPQGDDRSQARAGFGVGKPASLLRLGLAVDAVTRHLGDDTAAVYPVAERGLLSDTDLSSNERMVIRRWSDDGLVEVIPAGTPALARAREIGELTGLTVVSRAPGGTALLPAPGGAALVAPRAPAGPGHDLPAPGTHPALRRWWRCPEPGCPSFGGAPGNAQPPPLLAAGVPTCPRHGARLADAGPRPPAVALTVRVDGVVRQRFAVVAGRPVNVGRMPEDAGAVALGSLLDEQTGRWISRTHVRFELTERGLAVTDVSTNGTWVLSAQGQRSDVPPHQPHPVGEWDAVVLHDRVEIARPQRRAGAAPGAASVMGDAPTMALRLPRP
jgi:hypothetical protein